MRIAIIRVPLAAASGSAVGVHGAREMAGVGEADFAIFMRCDASKEPRW